MLKINISKNGDEENSRAVEINIGGSLGDIIAETCVAINSICKSIDESSREAGMLFKLEVSRALFGLDEDDMGNVLDKVIDRIKEEGGINVDGGKED